jgi:Flp pilus assembly protein TadG
MVALASVALFAFAALALDGGNALADRRSDQSITDHAALAAVQALAGNSLPSTTQQGHARKDAIEYLERNLGTWTGTLPACTWTANIDPTSNPCNLGSYDVTVTTPYPTSISGFTATDLNYMVQVKVTHHMTGRLLSAAGLGNAFTIGASALAFNGTPSRGRTHAVWSTYIHANGGGNTMFVDDQGFSGAAQIDDSQNGAASDCNNTSAADVFSDEKIHAPSTGGAILNINGNVSVSKVDHDQKLRQWWGTSFVNYSVSTDNDPRYQPPDNTASNYTANPQPTVSGSTVTFQPGEYTSTLTVQPAGSFAGKSWSGATTFIFDNGIYWFHGASIVFASGSYAAYSQDYDGTLNNGLGGFPSTRTKGADGETDGVEFYVDGSGYFWAKGGTVNIQAPKAIASKYRRSPGGTHNEISVYIDQNDTGDTGQASTGWGASNVPLAVGTVAAAYPSGQYFHEQGVMYIQNIPTGNNAFQSSVGAFIEPGSLDLHHYVVQGQIVAPYVDMGIGNVSGATTYTGCHDDTQSNPGGAAKLVQYDPNFLPTEAFGTGAELVQ